MKMDDSWTNKQTANYNRLLKHHNPYVMAPVVLPRGAQVEARDGVIAPRSPVVRSGMYLDYASQNYKWMRIVVVWPVELLKTRNDWVDG